VRAVLPANAQILYAVKANAHPAVTAALLSTVDGLEVAPVASWPWPPGAAPRIAFSGPPRPTPS